jgi:uncharacterized protein (DUF2062 family)/2-polyprenyl-3-methyl-5-hydroxy-6-metoxy-1,4-benzoquinol methylase
VTKTATAGRVPGTILRIWRVLRGGETTPARAATSVAVGLFIGCLPLYGLHFVLCALACLPFGLDLVLAYLAANISNPVVSPFLIAVEIEVGSFLLARHWVDWRAAVVDWSSAGRFARQWVVGSLVVGTVVAALGASIAWVVTSRRRGTSTSTSTKSGDVDRALERTVARYRGAPRGDRIYVALKLRTDPVADLVASIGPLGDVVDVGAGRGQLGVFLLEAGRITTLKGLDWDSHKVEVARSAANGLSAQFDVADARTATLPEADTVLLIDVLHYLGIEEQRALVERAAASLRAGGRLVVREADRSAGWRARLTVLAERVGRAVGMNRGARLAFTSAGELAEMLERSGLDTSVAAAAQGTPLANVLLVGARR